MAKKKKPKISDSVPPPPPTKEEIVAGLRDGFAAFDQAVDDYIDAVANGNQAQIQAARLALIITFRNLKRWEAEALIYQLGTLP